MSGLTEEQAWLGEDYGWIKQHGAGDLSKLFARCLGQPNSLGLFRFLRDVTTNEEAQLWALHSGNLLRALDQVFHSGEEEKVGVNSVALQFVSNCIAGRFESGAGARELVWKEFDFPKAVKANVSAASLILYLLCVVDDNNGAAAAAERKRELTDKRKAAWDLLLDVCEKEQCAYWVLVAVADSCYETSAVLSTAKRVTEVLDEEEKDFPVHFALHELAAAGQHQDKQEEENQLLVKLATWSADHAVSELALAKRVLDFCFARIAAPQLATTQCLQLIANVLTKGNDRLKDYTREQGAIKSILLLTRTINPKFPTQREWALFAFRACCEGSPANQQYVYQLQTQSPPQG
ncbi:hypothetical protein BASA81_002460 [Batrachochytrium salamandrivorans]|nr:hypothetical protein BASA81_002460 [Batrachochytrium salamandrivorans]